MRRAIQRQTILKKNGVVKSDQGRSRVSSFYNSILLKQGRASVCVIRRLGGIGDVLMVIPALKQLKKDFPKLHLTYAVDMHSTSNNVYYSMVHNLPFIDKVVDARFVNETLFDAVTDVSSVCMRYEHTNMPTLNRIDIFARAMGLPNLEEKKPEYKVEESEKKWARDFLKKLPSGKKVVIHTASMEPKRCWPIQKYISLIEQALKDQLPVHFVVLDFNHVFDHWDQYKNVTTASSTDLRQMAALIGQADLFIGPDSGPMHLAGALNIPSIVIFGSIPPEARINHYPTHEAVKMTGLSCMPCWYKNCPYNNKCMRDLDYSVVYAKMRARLLS